ncbi:methyltransferase domain-containing protein [Lewinella sp. W8]|nr:methyltransferase domain-containing protein [Lewinella sp. W8]
MKGEGTAGDLAIIFDRRKDRFLGIGLYDPDSPIRIRVLHQGKSVKIDADFFAQRIAEARALRTHLLATDTNGYRLLHGENDRLPGLVVDVYAGVAVLKLYTPVWFPYLDWILPAIQASTGAETTVLRLARNVAASAATLGYSDGQILAGELADENVVFREHGVRFFASVLSGHKTGFFLDHRHNRKRVGELAKGKQVLDVFSYAGGFSVHALAGGARRVVSVDISGPAMEAARANVELNDLDLSRHEGRVEDAFDALAELLDAGEQFDLVIVDPPSFAKRATEIAGALKAYQKINSLAIPLVRPGGILLAASCSARVPADDFFGVVEKTLRKSGRNFREVERTFHDQDHPIDFPEGAYLKSAYYRLE